MGGPRFLRFATIYVPDLPATRATPTISGSVVPPLVSRTRDFVISREGLVGQAETEPDCNIAKVNSLRGTY
jgi:hypothetical protein